jgi:hypothetical protein
MKNEHTPGPWRIGNATEVHAPDGARIVMCCQTHDDAESDHSEANARLIAAAPDLLDAAMEMAMLFENALRFGAIDNRLILAESIRNILSRHHATIAKATGAAK